MHPRRRRQRGYNQAALLAQALARLGRWRYLDALGRVKETTPSPGLGKQARQENLLGAFQARARVDGLRVLLVDDVLTSGATAAACVAVLLAAGAAEVHVAVVARKP
jgi:ComF family protein